MSPQPNPTDHMPDLLTPRQQRIMECIGQFVSTHGFPPTVREICERVGLSSPSSVHSQLRTLEEMGYLNRNASLPRAMELLPKAYDHLGIVNPTLTGTSVPIPLVGAIAAGAPILAEEHIDEYISLPESIVGDGTLFALTVRGESMIEAGVLPGDTVIVRQQQQVEQGEMCAALIEDGATVKYFRRTRAGDVFLDPANEYYEPIPLTPEQVSAAIMGKVVAVLRKV
ncbi:transcriptional repressor LexA [Stomatohabitans albus]|uniref:transcriptional repressor LexA n=1 Tax=Stomatohabitans albus TaxID=3110766 RepID=UPI00300CBF30